MEKKISIIARHNRDSHIVPLTILWDDGREFKIDKIMNIARVQWKDLGFVTKYDCWVRRKRVFLYYDRTSWYMVTLG